MTDLALPSVEDARQLTARIKVAVEGTWLLVQEAYTSRTWAVLGYDSWDAYCNTEFGDARLRLPREERRDVVVSLRESGLTLRAIEAVTGVSRKTIIKDSRSCLVETPPLATRTVLGVNGRVYPASSTPSRPDPASRQLDEERPSAMPRVELANYKTIGPPVTDRRGRNMPQRAQRKAIAEGISLITGLCIGFARLDDIDEAIDAEEAAQWVRDLSESLRVLRSLNNKLKEHASGSY
jgi:hypothetical protein